MKNRGKRIVNFALMATTLIIVSIVIAGCTSSSNQPAIQSSSEGTPAQTATTTISAPLTTTIIPTTLGTTPSAQLEMGTKSDTGTQIESTTKIFKPFSNDRYRISMIYPADWEKEELKDFTLRDYGQNTQNIVNFYSPTINSDYSVFSVDIDQNTNAELDDYYNHAILALQDYHGSIEVTRHMSNWKISDKTAYRIDYVYYDHKIGRDQKALLVVTKINENVYIISSKGYGSVYDDNLDEAEAMMKSIKILPVTEEKHR